MKPRESWGTKIGFLMATAGSAIGLGSLWKFPYVTGTNGGGLFVLAYLFFTFLIGVPMFMSELVIGRTSHKAPVGALAELAGKRKSWRFLGWSAIIAAFFILSYYAIVSGWALNYVLMSLLSFNQGKSPEEISEAFNLLYQSSGMNLFWMAIFLGITTAIVHRGIRQGIEFWSKILMPLLFAILIGLFLYAITLDGFSEAFSFVFKPEVDKFKPSGLLEALGLSCFTLSVGMGILITYGSYMHAEDDIPNTAFTVAGMTLFVSLIASLMIFPIIFTFGFTPEEGPGLLFKTLPVLFSKLPGTLLISTTFFALVVFAALTSTISVMEVLVASVKEVFDLTRGKGALIVGGAVFIMGIPSALAGSGALFPDWAAVYGKNFFETIDSFVSTWLLPINTILIAFFVGWVMKKDLLRSGFVQGSRFGALFSSWLFLVRWVVPLGIILVILQEGGIINIDDVFRGLSWHKAQ